MECPNCGEPLVETKLGIYSHCGYNFGRFFAPNEIWILLSIDMPHHKGIGSSKEGE